MFLKIAKKIEWIIDYVAIRIKNFETESSLNPIKFLCRPGSE